MCIALCDARIVPNLCNASTYVVRSTMVGQRWPRLHIERHPQTTAIIIFKLHFRSIFFLFYNFIVYFSQDTFAAKIYVHWFPSPFCGQNILRPPFAVKISCVPHLWSIYILRLQFAAKIYWGPPIADKTYWGPHLRPRYIEASHCISSFPLFFS